ncbi:glutamate-5-semialdehyde dehydrogenase [Emergomyces pasteurianus Ep9510]|uniref:glutamate-5-semialdehyde dehydrogenase n=1 Tax=Emergomyces pasteurianus Ep9510 TaxID=1447872 RepID=A0A1J9PNE5_9EURO|nr:glutamate-5-semialdehyde dehydrogenase [Emergomyces pasteurianus Ep9510]
MSLTEASPAEAARIASESSRLLATLSGSARNEALDLMYASLSKQKDAILEANARDIKAATRAAENGELSMSLIKRLDLSKPGKYEDMLKGILDVRDLEDPIGKVTLRTLLDDDLILERVTCPIGVLLIIFEARPEVIVNIAALSIKSGNAAILKGGKESTESFVTISKVIAEAISQSQVPNASIQLVKTRDVILPLLAQDKYIDLVIPRGSNELVRHVKDNTKIPVLGHADGICSIYLHSDADLSMATKIIIDAKTGYPAACNAVETLLVDQDAVSTLLPAIAEALLSKGVTLRCDSLSKQTLQEKLTVAQSALLQDATEDDYKSEFLDLTLAVKTVSPTPTRNSVDVAIAHINSHSSKHTDVILTSSKTTAERFLAGVDSAGVYWNASSRLADGMRYGFGTEVGISTNKIHSRGPVGLEGLTIYKYLIRGMGQVAGDYFEGEGGKSWKHRKLRI